MSVCQSSTPEGGWLAKAPSRAWGAGDLWVEKLLVADGIGALCGVLQDDGCKGHWQQPGEEQALGLGRSGHGDSRGRVSSPGSWT